MNAELIKIVRDWSVVAGGLLVVGPLAGSIADWLRTPSGLESASPLTASSSITGLLVGVLVVAIAVGYAILVGRIAHVRLALICTGLVLAWPAWRFGTVASLVRDSGDLSVVSRLAVEGAIFGSLTALGCALIIRFSRPVEPDTASDVPVKTTSRPDAKPSDWGAATLAAVLAGGLAAWLLAQSPLQGQTFAAAVAAGVVGGAAGRSVSARAPMLALLVGGLLLAVAGPLFAQISVSGDPLARLYAGQWPGLGLLTPFDWIAGILLGTPIGEMWAHSMVDRQSQAGPAARPASSS